MSADKRALDDLDALFRAVPAGAVPSSRPSKKVRNGWTAPGTGTVVSTMKPNEEGEIAREGRSLWRHNYWQCVW